MRKKLVFFIFIGDNTLPKDRVLNNGVARVHFYCLRKYRHCFDEATFVLSCTEQVLRNPDVISSYMEYIMSLGYVENTKFVVEKNTVLREAATVKWELVDSKDNEGKLLFFSHLRGEHTDNESVRKWVFSNYFMTLGNVNNVEYWLAGANKVFFGFPMADCRDVTPNSWEIIPKYGYYFLGSIYWANISILREVIKRDGTEPPMFGRFYSENFPASCVNWDMTATACDTACKTGYWLYDNFDGMFNEWCERTGYDRKEFDDAYAEIENGGC